MSGTLTLERNDMPPIETPNVARHIRMNEDGKLIGDYPKTFLDILMNQQEMRSKIENIETIVQGMVQEKNSDHFSRKDVVNYVMGGIAASGVLFTGIFFLIGTQVLPVQTSLMTFEAGVMDRNKSTSEVILSIRTQVFDMQKELGDVRLENARMQARLDAGGVRR